MAVLVESSDTVAMVLRRTWGREIRRIPNGRSGRHTKRLLLCNDKDAASNRRPKIDANCDPPSRSSHIARCEVLRCCSCGAQRLTNSSGDACRPAAPPACARLHKVGAPAWRGVSAAQGDTGLDAPVSRIARPLC